MMNKFYITLITVSVFTAQSWAQVPSNYYDSAAGLTGYALKSELANIISANYNAQSYDDLRDLYAISDNDAYYDNGQQTTTILDLYSENPNGADPYTFSATNTNDRCGNYSGEGDCWNREHIFPQGFFNQLEPMRSDAHHVIPTDGFVNGGRSNLPFGEVDLSGSGIRTYQNGSRKGPSATPGYTGDVFEPIDEFKGDIARMLLYFATRYEDRFNDNRWDSPNATNDPRDGSQDQYYEQWYIDLLLSWHAQDPVSQREIDRNNDIYNFQNNANPYIDNPQFVDMIWNSSQAPSGSIFATLTDSYNDVNSNGYDAGDEINYDYTIENLGNTTLYNVTVTASRGNFANTVSPIASIAPGQVINNPFGNLQVVLITQDVDPNGACDVINQLQVTADFSANENTGGLSIASDDPDNFQDVDSNNDNLPDDPTISNVCGGSTGTVSELFISEYIEGSGSNKAIEIANFTGSQVNLSGYSIERNANGGSTWSGTISLSGTLDNGEVYVLARGNADQAILDEADRLIGNGNALDFNGNDPVGLFRNGNLIDIVGVFNSGSTDFAKDVVLVRKPDAVVPNLDFNLTRDWNSFGQSNYTDLGQHTVTTASEDQLIAESFKVYPNPSKDGIFYFETDLEEIELNVFDLSGRSISFDQTQDSIQLEQAGIYILTVEKDGNRSSLKLVLR
ncbi:ribonuclease [Nonlabens spongiae]|uniref:Ribonuclease n=1 Tax=Nonlabens spongiae TaxID=331648 RepID=A0A1W6MP42_9FLAO|nr:endonuclease [Nonlabens spongiae]ARN79332.1 ribonuclease [Nonlabens spongiae]